jgi:hypothetical protein
MYCWNCRKSTEDVVPGLCQSLHLPNVFPSLRAAEQCPCWEQLRMGIMSSRWPWKQMKSAQGRTIAYTSREAALNRRCSCNARGFVIKVGRCNLKAT